MCSIWYLLLVGVSYSRDFYCEVHVKLGFDLDAVKVRPRRFEVIARSLWLERKSHGHRVTVFSSEPENTVYDFLDQHNMRRYVFGLEPAKSISKGDQDVWITKDEGEAQDNPQKAILFRNQGIGELIGQIRGKIQDSAPTPALEPEEESEFEVVLVAISDRVAAIKLVRSIKSLGLKEAKEFVDSLPQTIYDCASKEEADKAREEFSKVGAKVAIN